MRKSNSSHKRAANDELNELKISIAIYYVKLETDEKLENLIFYNSIVTICLLDR